MNICIRDSLTGCCRARLLFVRDTLHNTTKDLYHATIATAHLRMNTCCTLNDNTHTYAIEIHKKVYIEAGHVVEVGHQGIEVGHVVGVGHLGMEVGHLGMEAVHAKIEELHNRTKHVYHSTIATAHPQMNTCCTQNKMYLLTWSRVMHCFMLRTGKYWRRDTTRFMWGHDTTRSRWR